MTDISEQERETLHHIVNGDVSARLRAEDVERLLSLGLVERAGSTVKATPAGRVAGIPRPEHL